MSRARINRLKRIFPQRGIVRSLWHRKLAFLAALRYGFPARRLAVIGITGTDGKTTTVGMVTHILQSRGLKVGALSTAFFSVAGETTWNATQKTSPSPFTVQKFLRTLLRAKCTHAVLEFSSHGLVQGRTSYTWPFVAAITNTTPEHLDYHGTMEQYRKDKGKLFRMLRKTGTKVLNGEDGTYPLLAKRNTRDTIVYTQHNLSDPPRQTFGNALLWANDVHARPDSSSATIHSKEAGQVGHSTYALELAIPGTFNVENALCALGCARGARIPLSDGVQALATFRGIPGRIEKIPGPQNFSVYVDFTVTPAAYEKTLHAVRATLQPGNRILVLTGSCGDRMREKRPLVGKICSELADVVVVSNEDPYTEDPEKIMDEVWAGVDATKTEAHRIPDRREAIRFLITQARAGDAVLLCGKGSDTMMWVKGGQVPWNEREIARGMLQELTASAS